MTKKFFVGLALIASMSLVAFTVAPSESTKTEQTARKTYYGGSASVRAKNKNNSETRMLNTNLGCCCYEDKGKAKYQLEMNLKSQLKYYEVLDSSISYDIDTCEQ